MTPVRFMIVATAKRGDVLAAKVVPGIARRDVRRMYTYSRDLQPLMPISRRNFLRGRTPHGGSGRGTGD